MQCKQQDRGAAYGGNGNLTTDLNGVTYGHDYEDRVTSVGGALTAAYRADGLRAWKNVPPYGPIYFIYDGDRVVCEINSSGSMINDYGYGANGLVQRYSYDASQYYGYTFDPQGSLVQRHRQKDQPPLLAADTAVYDAFGKLRGDVNAQDGTSYGPVAVGTKDSVGFLGQWGVYTDREIQAVSPGMVLAGTPLPSPIFTPAVP